jgi:ABC-type dipeptide/oligopeptide/nickel transport system permease component
MHVVFRQFLKTLAGLWGVVVLVQALLVAAPGDAINLLPDSDRLRPLLEAEWGLNLPAWQQIFLHTAQVFTGKLGYSLIYQPGTPVSTLLLQRGGVSLLLLTGAFLTASLLGLGLGFLGASKKFSWLSRIVRVFSVVPAFLMAFLLVTGINAGTWALMEAEVISRPSWFALPDSPGMVKTLLAIAILSLASGILTDAQAAATEETRLIQHTPYVLAARSLREPILPLLLHNLAPALIAVLPGRLSALLGSLVVVEKLLLVPGAGAMLWNACLVRDYPVVGGCALLAAALVWGARVFCGLLVGWLDPRRSQA